MVLTFSGSLECQRNDASRSAIALSDAKKSPLMKAALIVAPAIVTLTSIKPAGVLTFAEPLLSGTAVVW